MARKISELFFELRAKTEGLSHDLDESERQLGKWSQFVAAHPVAVAGALGAAILEIGIKATEMAAESDKAFRQVAAALPTGTAGIKELDHAIEELSIKTGIADEALEAVAVQAARLGAGSADDVRNLVTAAAELSDATGTSISESVTLLTQLRREFGLTDEQALDTAAKLADAAQKGHVSVDELFAAFQAGTHTFQQFGIDVDTGTRAIVAMVQSGEGIKKIRHMIDDADAETIREWASRVHLAGDEVQRLSERAEIVRGGTDRLGRSIKNELNINLKELGELILPAANKGLAELLGLLDRITHHQGSLGDRFRQGAQQVIDILGDQRLGLFTGPTMQELLDKYLPPPPPPLPEGFKSAIPDSALGIGVSPHAPGAHPLGIMEKKQLEAARQALAEVNQELKGLESTTDSLTPKSDAFGKAIDKWAEKAIKAKLPANELAAAIAFLREKQREIAADEFTKALDDQAKAAKDAFDALTAAGSQFTGVMAQFDATQAQTFAALAEKRKTIFDVDKLKAFDAGVKELTDHYAALRVAVGELAVAEKEIAAVRERVNVGGESRQQLNDEIEKQIRAANAARDAMNGATDPAVAEQYKKELDEINALLDELVAKWNATDVATKHAGKSVLEIVDNWAKVARGLIGVAQAIGKVDAATAALIQNAVSFGESLGKAVKSKGGDVGADVEALGSLGGLISAIGNMGHAASQARQRANELAASIAHLFQGLENQLSPTKGSSLKERQAALEQQYADARNQIERELGGKKNQTAREKRLDQLAADEIEAKRLLDEQFAREQLQAQEDYKVRELRAKGLDAEADALSFAEQQQREYADAVASGADATTLAALAAAQAAEAYQHAAESALQAALTSTQQSEQVHHVTDPVQLFEDKAKAYAAVGGALGDLLSQFDLDHLDPAQIAAIDAQLQALFDQLKNPETADSVDLAGLSIDEFIAAILDLSSAVQTAAQQMAEAEAQLRTGFDILGTGAAGQAQAFAQLYGFDLGNISTQEGVNAAIASLQALYAANPDDQEKAREIENVINALRAIQFPGAAAAGGGSSLAAGSGERNAIVNGAQALTDNVGSRMADYLATADVYLAQLVGLTRQEVTAITQMIAALSSPIITGPILPPTLPTGFGSSPATRTTTNGSTPGDLNIYATFNVRVGAPVGADPESFGALIGTAAFDQFIDLVERAMGDRWTNAQIRAGSTIKPI